MIRLFIRLRHRYRQWRMRRRYPWWFQA